MYIHRNLTLITLTTSSLQWSMVLVASRGALPVSSWLLFWLIPTLPSHWFFAGVTTLGSIWHAYTTWAGSCHLPLVVKGPVSHYLLWRGSHKWFLRGTFAACLLKTCRWILRAARASVLSQSLQRTRVLHGYLSQIRSEKKVWNVKHINHPSSARYATESMPYSEAGAGATVFFLLL